MTLSLVKPYQKHVRPIYLYRCDGCGASVRQAARFGPVKGWRRIRAGSDLIDLCPPCQGVGVVIDALSALAAEARYGYVPGELGVWK